MNVEKSIRICLAMNSMSMADLADKLEISKTRVYRLADNPTAATILKLSGTFGIKPSEFIALGEDK